jgi:hypothetical protein
MRYRENKSLVPARKWTPICRLSSSYACCYTDWAILDHSLIKGQPRIEPCRYFCLLHCNLVDIVSIERTALSWFLASVFCIINGKTLMDSGCSCNVGRREPVITYTHAVTLISVIGLDQTHCAFCCEWPGLEIQTVPCVTDPSCWNWTPARSEAIVLWSI